MAGLEFLSRAALETTKGLLLRGGTRWLAAELLGRLEEEKVKILVFQREIPLSVSIVSYIVDFLKVEDEEDRRGTAARNGSGDGRPVFEEFIPVHREPEEEETDADQVKNRKEPRNKANWMSSALLWSGGSNDSNGTEGNSNSTNSGEVSSERRTKTERSEESASVAQIQDVNSNIGGKGSTIIAGNGSAGLTPEAKDEATKLRLPQPAAAVSAATSVPLPPFSGLSLRTPAVVDADSLVVSPQRVAGPAAFFNGDNLAGSMLTSEGGPNNASARKARRCWSADLHRRFLCALEKLGGAQAATPKQIRELMKVDGLTNDEVKSHLQKYRLHARKRTTKDHKRPDLRLDLRIDAENGIRSPKLRSGSSSSPTSHFEAAGSANEKLHVDGKLGGYSWDGYNHNHRPGASLWTIT